MAEHAELYKVILGERGMGYIINRILDFISEVSIKLLTESLPADAELPVPRELIARLDGEHVIEFSLMEPIEGGEDWSQLPGVSGQTQDNGLVRLSVSQPHEVIPELLSRLKSAGRKLASLTTRHASLEDVFVTLTGRRLDDEEPAE